MIDHKNDNENFLFVHDEQPKEVLDAFVDNSAGMERVFETIREATNYVGNHQYYRVIVVAYDKP
jgi:hypothetical protein